MYYLLAGLFLPIINALLTVQIHQRAIYNPHSACAFLQHVSLSNDASIQTCIWQCQNTYDCHTAVYFNDNKTCSMFSEFCMTDRIESSGSVAANVICYRKNHQPVTTCSSTLTTVVEETTSTMEMCTSITSTVTTAMGTVSLTKAFWSFDSNYNDLYNVYNGSAINNASFFPLGYTGYGSALSLNASQYVRVSRFLNMTYTSFTWEFWAYSTSTFGSDDNFMIAMCASSSHDNCLHLIIRNNTPLFGFYADDCSSSAIVEINQWHHFAFVYDYTYLTQYTYLNGQLVCKQNPRGPFQGNSGNITIGALIGSSWNRPTFFWTGYIDQLSYVSRAKAETEILTDATLVAYYSFDNGSYYDSGPNNINGIGVNVSPVAGRVNQSILFNASEAYFQANGFTLLGASYRSYSVALWVKSFSPAVGNGTIVHLSSDATGAPGWCLPIIGLTSTNQIVGQNVNNVLGMVHVTGPTLPPAEWTHIVTSYNVSNGIRLWVNGSLVNASGAFTYSSSGVADTITLGSSLNGTSGCISGLVQKGQFYGMMDELRVYSRELNACDVHALANP